MNMVTLQLKDSFTQGNHLRLQVMGGAGMKKGSVWRRKTTRVQKDIEIDDMVKCNGLSINDGTIEGIMISTRVKERESGIMSKV